MKLKRAPNPQFLVFAQVISRERDRRTSRKNILRNSLRVEQQRLCRVIAQLTDTKSL